MAFTIDNLEIQIDTNAKKAESGLDSLAASLAKLKTAVGDTSGLASNLKDIATALHTFSVVGKVRMTVPINQLKKLESVIPTLSSPQATQMADNLTKIAYAIEKFSASAGVGAQMKDAAKGMNALAKSTKSFETATQKANGAHKGTISTLASYVNKYRRLYLVIDEVVDVCADLFDESNEYIESLNLFKVTMGDASDAALEYANSLRDAMGIDPAEWITNQGTFQRMATGFGIASDEAEIMSQNLTQLAYDMSSFFNTDVQTAMQKLQSGMSGQIKGLKIWGYNLSVAALQETALNLGIEESVRNMTEAQKAQLRYITLIQRSNGVMGDMAKTINTPANSLRILDAQITQFKRSLGNLVSVIVTKVIPYVQAFVELMAEAAEALAEAWGFEIKDLPTNNLEMASDVIEGIGDDIDNTTDSVSELKKQLAGFDELNILGNGGEEEKKDASYSLGIDLPEYDFLANLDTQTREKIDAIKNDIKELFPLLDALARAFALAFAVSTFNKARTALAKFFTTTSVGETIALSAMLAFDKFKDTLKATKNPLKALGSAGKEVWKNFKVAMSSLSPLTKTLVSVVALGIEFDVVKKNVKGLADGSKSLGDALLAIIPTCALVGVAMYAMLGPWGLALTAIVGVTGAIVGWAEAENEARRQFAHDTFYNDYGKSVSDLATEFNNLMTESTKAYDIIFEKQADVLDAKQNVIDVKTEIDLLISEVTNGATTIEEAIPRMTSAFEALYNESKNYLLGTASLLYAALTGSTLDGIEEYMRTISEVTGASIQETDESYKRLEEAKKKYESGEITAGELWDIQIEEYANVSSLTSMESSLNKKVNDAFSGFAEMFKDGINWESDNLEADLQALTNGAESAKETIKEAYKAIYNSLEEVRAQAEKQGNTDAIIKLDKMLIDFQSLENADLGKVDRQLDAVLYGLQENIANKGKEFYDSLEESWENLPGYKRLFYNLVLGGKEGFNRDSVKGWKEEVSPVIESLKEVFGEDKIVIDDVFSNISTSYGGYQLGLIERDFRDAAKETVDGLVLGLSSEQQEVYNASRALGNSVLEAYDEALGIHSPSREMIDRGKDTIQGLVNGLGDQTALSQAIDGIVDKFDILEPIQKLWKNVTSWWKNISLPDVNLLGNFGARIPGMFNVGWYASGGFPTMGEMFVARERGPELVGRIGNKSAVANNDQIITGIASAVYSAMMAAQEDGNNGEGGSSRIVIQIGDQAVGEASVRYINGRIVQTGASPIYS